MKRIYSGFTSYYEAKEYLDRVHYGYKHKVRYAQICYDIEYSKIYVTYEIVD